MKRTIFSALLIATATMALSGCKILPGEIRAADNRYIMSATLSTPTITSAGVHTITVKGMCPWDSVNVILPAGRFHSVGGKGKNLNAMGADITRMFSVDFEAENVPAGTYQVKVTGKDGYPDYTENVLLIPLVVTN